MSDKELSQDQKICQKMDAIGRKILIMSGKGGVGKTTVTVNIANALLAQGFSVGVLDTDIHGPNVAKMFGCEQNILMQTEDGEIQPVSPRENLKIVSLSFALNTPTEAVVFRGPMKLSVIKQFLSDVAWGTLDYLLIDSPPGTGDEQLAVCQSIPAMTGAIIVTTPQEVALLDARRSVSFATQLDLDVIGVVENMSYLSCPDCGKHIPIFGTGGGKKLCEEYNLDLLGEIPMELSVREGEDNGVNLIEGNTGVTAQKFMEIAKHIHKITKPSCSADIGYVPKGPECSPSSCATCTQDCPSRKK